MANEEKKELIGSKIRRGLFNLGGTFQKKYGKTIEALPGKALQGAKNIHKFKGEVEKTVQDIPAIAGEQALTAGPRFLDVINDYAYKPIKRNIQALAGADIDEGDNALDKVAEAARDHKKKFFETHEFNQEANRRYGEMLGNVLEAAAPVPAGKGKVIKPVAGALSKYGNKVINLLKKTGSADDLIKATSQTKGKVLDIVQDSTSLVKTEDKVAKGLQAVLSKDKKLKKATQALDTMKKDYSKTKNVYNVQEQARIEAAITAKENEIAALTKKASDKYSKTVRTKTKTNKELDSIANPKSTKSKIVKGLGVTAGVGAIGAGVGELLGDDDETTGDEKEIITTDVPNPFADKAEGEATGESGDIDTAEDEKKSGDLGDKKDPTVKDKKSTPAASTIAGEVYAQDGSPVQLLLIGGTYKVRGPDGTLHTLATGITQANKRHKYNLISNQALPF